MYSLKALLQLPVGWKTIRSVVNDDGVTLHLQSTRKTAHCPNCLIRSHSAHSFRQRRIQHLSSLPTFHLSLYCPLDCF